MKIGILTNYQLEQIGGAEEALDRLASLWHQAGHEVVLFCPRPPQERRKRPWKPAYRYVPIPRPFSTRYFLRRFLPYLRQEHRRGPLDVVLASDTYWPGHVARMFWRQTGVPYVTYSHGGDVMHGSRFLKRPRVVERMRLAIRAAAAVACISQYVRQRQEELAMPRGIVRLIPNGWPDEWSELDTPPPIVQGPYLFGMGRIVELKGFQTLIQAFNIVRARHPSVRLVIAGDGPYLPQLLELAQRLGLPAHRELPDANDGRPGVFLPGFVQGEAKRALLCHATLAVSPSIRQEPMSLVLFEMLCCGVPVIGSNVGGTPDILRPGINGDLFPAGDGARLAEILGRILQHPEECHRLARQARPSVEPYRWSRIAAAYLQLFQEVRHMAATADAKACGIEPHSAIGS